MPGSDVFEVTDWLIDNTPDMHIELQHGQREKYCAGLQFASQFVGGLMPGQVVDYLPEQQLDEVRNIEEFAGILAVEPQTGNCTGRTGSVRSQTARANSSERLSIRVLSSTRELPSRISPLRGVDARDQVYTAANGWGSFGHGSAASRPWTQRRYGLSRRPFDREGGHPGGDTPLPSKV